MLILVQKVFPTGPEIAINTYDPNGGTWQFCEMTLHNKAIADGSADDIAMINYLRNKWKTPGLPPKTKTTVRQAELSGGGYLGPLAIANDGTLLIAQNGSNCWRWNNGVNAQFENVFGNKTAGSSSDLGATADPGTGRRNRS